MRQKLALCLALLAFAACPACAERRIGAGSPPESSTQPSPFLPASTALTAPALLPGAPSDPGATPEASPGTSTGAAPVSWIDAVRLERWAEAALRIDALAEADRARPEMRYVRARSAIGAGDSARALPLLENLEASLPLLAADVARYRAEAQLAVGPYAEAAAYFAKSSKSRDLNRAAQAYEKAGQAEKARRMADTAVAAAQQEKSVRAEVEARMVRARLHKAQSGDAAAEPDYRWVAVHSPASDEGRAAATALAGMKKPLSPKERLQTVDGLVESGSPDAVAEIERMSREPAAPKGELNHARAMALYKARNYPEAAKAFEAAAKGPGKSGHEAEELFYAARSLARADRDEEAIKTYLEVASKYKKSPYAERAQYLAARLYLQTGKYKEAEKAYGAHLATYKKSDLRDEASYERALAELSSGSFAGAQRDLEGLAARAHGDDVNKLRELAGVAALRAGDKPRAIAIWTDIARAQPLSWAALASRARLLQAGAEIPPLLESAAARPPSPLPLKLPPAPALLASVGLDGDAEGRLAAGEREVASAYSGREGEALCGLYGMLSRGKRRYRVGVTAVNAEALLRAPPLSERWTWECLFPQPFALGVSELEARYALPRGILHALMRQESAFDPVIVSPASAVGLLQLMPSTAKQAATELSLPYEPQSLTTPDTNLRLGAFYITKLLKMFRGQVVLAAAAYNAGPRAVSHWIDAGSDNEIDLWVARIPYDETRTYVARVTQNLARYQWLAGGDAAVSPLSLGIPEGAKAPGDAY